VVIDQLLEEARTVTGASLGNLQMVNWKRGCLEIVAEHGFQQEFLTHFAKVEATDATCCGRALQGRGQIVLEDVEEDLNFPQYGRVIMLNAGARACLSTPLISSSGAFVGIVSTHFQTAHRLPAGKWKRCDRWQVPQQMESSGRWPAGGKSVTRCAPVPKR
jgi:GAF domain-containing protein